MIFDDRPNYWDAWGKFELVYFRRLLTLVNIDVEIHHLETARPLAFTDISIVADGPFRAAVRSVVKYGKSTITVTVSRAKPLPSNAC